MKKQMTIGKRLTLSFVVVLALTLAVAITSLLAIGRLGDALDFAINTTAQKTDTLGNVRAGFQEVKAQSDTRTSPRWPPIWKAWEPT